LLPVNTAMGFQGSKCFKWSENESYLVYEKDLDLLGLGPP
jgi:hypothetical protein